MFFNLAFTKTRQRRQESMCDMWLCECILKPTSLNLPITMSCTRIPFSIKIPERSSSKIFILMFWCIYFFMILSTIFFPLPELILVFGMATTKCAKESCKEEEKYFVWFIVHFFLVAKTRWIDSVNNSLLQLKQRSFFLCASPPINWQPLPTGHLLLLSIISLHLFFSTFVNNTQSKFAVHSIVILWDEIYLKNWASIAEGISSTLITSWPFFSIVI